MSQDPEIRIDPNAPMPDFKKPLRMVPATQPAYLCVGKNIIQQLAAHGNYLPSDPSQPGLIAASELYHQDPYERGDRAIAECVRLNQALSEAKSERDEERQHAITAEKERDTLRTAYDHERRVTNVLADKNVALREELAQKEADNLDLIAKVEKLEKLVALQSL